MKLALIIFCSIVISACASKQSVMPEKNDIKVSRKNPPKGCVNLGKVTGTSSSYKPNRKAVLEDMKQEAANKGATYLVVKQYSANGTSVNGVAYQCK